MTFKLADVPKILFPHFKAASPQATLLRLFWKSKNSKDAPLLRDLIKDTLPLIEDEEKKALATDGFELGTSRLVDRRSYHFATTVLQGYQS